MAPARDGDDPTAGAEAIVRARTVRPPADQFEVAGTPVVVERKPTAEVSGGTPRFDLALVSARPGTKVAPAGVRSLVRYLAAADVLAAPREVPGGEDGLTEVRAQPGSYAHSVFHPGPADPATTPAFHEAVLRFGTAPVPLWVDANQADTEEAPARPPGPVYFALEFRGCAFDFVHQRLVDRLYQVLYLRAAVFARPLAGPPTAAGPAPRRNSSRPRPEARTFVGGVGTTVQEKG